MRAIKGIKGIRQTVNTGGVLKTAAFAVVILGAVFTLQHYRLKYITRLQETVYAVEDKEMAKTLLRGERPENLFCELLELSEDEAVYRRGGNLYAGEGKTRLDGDFPFYANNGGALMLVEDTGKLVSSSFEEFDTFQGLYVSDGLSFNYDKTQADEDSFYFLKLKNGLYINVQPILFSYPGGESAVRMNSVFFFGNDSARYYEVGGDNMLQYGAVPTVSMATVTIGGETFSYESLLLRLGLTGERKNRGEDDKKADTAGELEAVPEEEPEKKAEDIRLTGGETEETIKEESAASDGKAQLGREKTKETKQEDAAAAEKKAERIKKERKPKNKQETAQREHNSGGAAGGNPAQGAGQSGAQDTGAQGGAQNPSAGEPGGVSGNDISGNMPGGGAIDPEDLSGNDLSGNDLSGNDLSGNVPGGFQFRPPTATIEPFTADIYSAASKLQITDYSGCLKRIVLEFNWQAALPDGSPAPRSDNRKDYVPKYRKTIRASGDVLVDNLPPGTDMYVRGIIYYIEDGETKYYDFYDGFEDRFQTKALDTVDDLYVEFASEPDGGVSGNDLIKRQPHQMQLFGFTVSGKNPNVVNKINRIRITAKENGSGADAEPYVLQIPISVARKDYYYKKNPEERPVWQSDIRQCVLPSNKSFNYTIELLDPFGTRFKNVIFDEYQDQDESIDWETEKSLSLFTEDKDESKYETSLGGTFTTAKTAPGMELQNRSREIDQALFQIRTEDPDNGAKPDTYRLFLYREGESEPVSFEIPAADGTGTQKVTSLALRPEDVKNGGEGTYTVKGLTAGCNYEARVVGNYDLQDRSGVYQDQIVGTLLFSTIPLSNYGQVYYTLSSAHVKTEYQPDGSIKYEDTPGADGGSVSYTPVLSDYESATAQKVYLSFNYRITKKDLVRLYMNKLHLEVQDMTDGGKSVLTADLLREKMKKVTVTGTGTDGIVELDACGMETVADEKTIRTALRRRGADGKETPYTPKIRIQMTDIPGSTNLWDALSEDPAAKLVLYWEDGSLLSNLRNYRVELTTYAYQGDREHNVTGQSTTSRRLAFTTLKKMPYATYTDVLLASDYIRVYGLDFHDEDKAITDGTVRMDLSGQSEKLYVLSYENGNAGAVTEPLVYDNLLVGSAYEIRITGEQIRRDREGRFILPGEELLSVPFTAGSGISGRLVFDSISYPLSGGESILRSDYSVYDGSDYRTDLMDSDTGVASDTLANAADIWSTSPYIAVTPGDYYYLDGLRGLKTQNSYIQFYTDEPNGNDKTEKTPTRINVAAWAGTSTQSSSRIGIYGGECVIEIPAGVTYMRFAMNGTDSNNVPCYATAQCYRLPKRTDDGGKPYWGAPGREILTEAPKNTIDPGTASAFLRYGVQAGKRYAFIKRDRSYRYEFLDESGKVISEGTSIWMYGHSEIAPAGAAELRVYNTSGSGASEAADFCDRFKLCCLDEAGLAWLNSRDIDKLASAFVLEVKDLRNNLIGGDDNKVYLKLSRYDEEKRIFEELTGGDNPIEDIAASLALPKPTADTTGNLNDRISFNGDTNRRFQLELSVRYRGEKIVLDTLEFETNRVKEVINDRTDLAKLMRYPNDDFVVVNDIQLRDNENFCWGVDFRGKLDFQGHTLKRKDTQRNIWGMQTLGPGGLIENVVLDYTLDNSGGRNEVSSNSGLVVNSSGTIRNAVVELSLGRGMYRKTSFGGLCNENNGVIENFALRYDASSSNYAGNWFGGLVMRNRGAIRNGSVYSPEPLNITTGKYGGTGTDGVPDGSINCDYTGLLVGYMDSSGSVENVYVSGSIAVEDFRPDHQIPSGALLIGVCSGTGEVRDCLSVGDMYKVAWKKDNGRDVRAAEPYYQHHGVMLAQYPGEAKKNNWYYSGLGLSYADNFAGRQEPISSPLLFRDLSFYNRTVNRNGSFLLSDISAGYLPRVNMPVEAMVRRQARVPLPPTTTSTAVRFLYAELEGEEHIEDGNGGANDYADATLVFSNILKRKIESVSVKGLTVTARDGGADLEQGMKDGVYEVKVRLKPDGTRFGTSYPVERFSYLGTEFDVENGQILAAFPKHVTNANWCDAFTDQNAEFFRLDETIVFAEAAEGRNPEDAQKAISSAGVFSGTFDGNGKALQGFKLDKYSSLFGTTNGAVIRDLTVKDFTITGSAGSNTDYRGLIGQCLGGTQMSGITFQNVRIENIRQHAGTLAGSMTGGRMWDCVAEGVVMESDQNSDAMKVGGLVGTMTRSRIENCFVKGLRIKAKAGKGAKGIGGLVGEADGNSIEKVYAQGMIESAFANTGGLCGSLNAALSMGWAKVNVSTQAAYAGGVVGLLSDSGGVTRTLAVGEVFTTAQDNFGRIAGGYSGNARTYAHCYASADQKINARTTTELFGAVGLMPRSELEKEFYYWDKPNIGSAFYYKNVENGELPKLYKRDGSALLPCQDSGVETVSTGVSFTASGVAELKEETCGDGAGAYLRAGYETRVTLRFQDERLNRAEKFKENAARLLGENYANLSIEDMELGKKEDGAIMVSEPVFGKDAEGPYSELTFTGLAIAKYVDGYRVILENGDVQSSAKLVFTDEDGEETPLYRHIYRTDELQAAQETVGNELIDLNSWVGAMRLAGYNYENFRVMRDLDFKGVPEGKIRTQLRINRLEGDRQRIDLEQDEAWTEARIRDEYLMADSLDSVGTGESGNKEGFVKIEGLTYTERSTSSVSWISELRGRVSYLNFKNIIWKNLQGGSRVGVIGTLDGSLSYVDIENLTLEYGKTGERSGFVGYAAGTLDYVRGRGISMRRGDSGGTNSIYYMGGVVGQSIQLVRHVGIKGSADRPYVVEGTGKDDARTGGVGGYTVRNLIFAYADGIEIKNCFDYAGGLTGYSDDSDVFNQYEKSNVETKAGVPYLFEVKNSRIEGSGKYIGGVTGNNVRLALSENNTVVGKYQIGGVSGRYSADRNTARGCTVTALEDYAGGISGYGNGGGYTSEVEGCTISAKRYAGGIIGRASNYNSGGWCGYVKDCAIYSEEGAGGYAGWLEVLQLQSGYVKDCVIGRKAKEHPEAVKQESGGYQVNMVADSTNFGTKYAGGLAGRSDGGSFICSVVDGATIYADAYGGGAIGYGGGGTSFDLMLNTNIYVKDSHAGGYAGYLASYVGEKSNGLAITKANTKVSRVILAGTIGEESSTTSQVGAFAGEFAAGELVRRDPETGKLLPIEGYTEKMTQEYFNRILLAQTAVHGGASTGLVAGKYSGGAQNWNEQIGYLRIYGAMEYGNETVREVVSDNRYTWVKPWVKSSGGVTAGDAFLVSTANLKDRDFYYETLANGGLYLTERTDWKKSDGTLQPNNFRHFLYTEYARKKGYFPFMAAWTDRTRRGPMDLDRVTIDNDAWEDIQKGIPVPEDHVAAAAYGLTDMSDLFSQVSLYASGAGTINLEFPGDMVTDEEDVEILKEELALMAGDAESGEADTAGGANGGDAASGTDGSGKDDAGSGTAGEGKESVGNGADIDPAWIPWARFTVYDGNGKTLAENDVTRKVYTIPYDYDTTLTVKVAAGGETRSYAVTGDALRRTVMSYGEHCYYLKADGVYRDNGSYVKAGESGVSEETAGDGKEIVGNETVGDGSEAAGDESETVGDGSETVDDGGEAADDGSEAADDGGKENAGSKADGDRKEVDGSKSAGGAEPDYRNVEKALGGSFIHLYKGKALDDNGRIFDLESGSQTGSLDADSLFVPGEAETPAYETTFSGKTVRTYRMFTRSDADEEETEYRAFAKNGKLFGVDPALDRDYGQGFTDFVADYYSTSQGSTEYMSMLSEDHVLEDYKTPLNWPMDKKKQQLLRNFQIDEVGDNLNAANPYVILRYADRTTAAFNYLTGALLFIDDTEKEDLGFAEYATLWLKGKKSALSLSNAYKGAAGVVGSLVENPIDDSLLVNYIKAPNTVGGDAESGTEVMDIATDGTNKKKGTNTTTGSSTLGGAGSETADGSADDAGSESVTGGTAVNGSAAGVGSEAADGSADGGGETVVSGSVAGNGSGTADGGAAGGGETVVNGSAAGNGSGTVNESAAGAGEILHKTETGRPEKAEGMAESGRKQYTGGTGTPAVRSGTAGNAKTEKAEEAGTGETAVSESAVAGAGSVETAKTEKAKEAGAGAVETAKTEKAKEAGAADTSGSAAGAEEAEVPLTSDRAYVTMVTAESDGYEVFRATELLSPKGSAVLSENRKLKVLQENGLLQNAIDLESMKLSDEENRTGLLLVGAAAAAMVLLLALLYCRRRKMNV